MFSIVITYLVFEMLYFLASLVFFSTSDNRKDFSFFILLFVVVTALCLKWYQVDKDIETILTLLNIALFPVYLFPRIKYLILLYKRGFKIVKFKEDKGE